VDDRIGMGEVARPASVVAVQPYRSQACGSVREVRLRLFVADGRALIRRMAMFVIADRA